MEDELKIVGLQQADSESTEKQQLAEVLLRLPRNDLQEFFRGFREIADQLSEECNEIQVQLCCMKNNLPGQLRRLHACRDNLLALKRTILKSMECYRCNQGQLLALLKENEPNLYNQLMCVSEQVKRLNYLKAIRSLTSASLSIKAKINASKFDTLYDYIQLLGKSSQMEMDLDQSKTKEIVGKWKQLFKKTEQLLLDALQNQFKQIHYPLEEATDTGFSDSVIIQIAALLECIGILDDGVVLTRGNKIKIMNELTAPLEKRFHFHFFTDQKTNNLTKPEWFFTQILLWISSNIDIVSSVLRRISCIQESHREMLNLYVSELVNLAKKKVQIIIKKVADQPLLFSHLIDECAAFEKELQQVAICDCSGDVLSVLCEDVYLVKWLQLERESCIAGIEDLLCREDCWSDRYRSFSDIDTQRVPECTDQFLLMIDSITERYRWINSIDVQSQFLNVQIFLLDDFRLRLVQISQQLSSPWQKPFIQILNSAWYIAYVLDAWNDVNIFLRIQALGKKAQLRGVFEDVANMYRHLWRQRSDDLCSAFFQHIRNALNRYERENWYMWEACKPLQLTSSFCPFLLEVRRLLGYINEAISPSSATKLYEMLNAKLAAALLQMVVTVPVNASGAMQILYDLTNSLVPVLNFLYSEHSAFASFEALDDPKFVEAISCLKILSQSTGTAILLYEELKRSTDNMTAPLLEPFNATSLDRQRAMELLRHRTDLQLIDTEQAVKL